jgi:hypothetical protein
MTPPLVILQPAFWVVLLAIGLQAVVMWKKLYAVKRGDDPIRWAGLEESISVGQTMWSVDLAIMAPDTASRILVVLICYFIPRLAHFVAVRILENKP